MKFENLALTPKERANAIATIEAMQHPRNFGMYADWWIKWLKRSVALDELYLSKGDATNDQP